MTTVFVLSLYKLRNTVYRSATWLTKSTGDVWKVIVKKKYELI